jgi:hypothetical protein
MILIRINWQLMEHYSGTFKMSENKICWEKEYSAADDAYRWYM